VAFFEGKSGLIEQVYCRPFIKFDAAEKRMVYFQYMKRASLEFFEGTPIKGLNQLLGGSDDTAIGAEDSKTLVIANMDILTFKRICLSHKDGYRYPVTVQLMGCNGEVYGVSVKIFDPESPQDDTNSQFLVVFNTLETGSKLKFASKKKSANFSLDDYRNKFGLVELMQNKGFDIILERLVEKPKAFSSPKIVFSAAPKGLHPQIQIIPLEQVFSLQQI
jgi:hypothetical protein